MWGQILFAKIYCTQSGTKKKKNSQKQGKQTKVGNPTRCDKYFEIIG